MSEQISRMALCVSILSLLLSSFACIGLAEGSRQEPAEPTEAVTVATETEIQTEVTEYTEETEVPTEAAQEPETPTEYIEAQRVWEMLRKRYTEAVTAGIMGNLMAEVGGGTLRLRWDAYGEGGNYYGICQWNRWDFRDVQGKDMEYQIDYLLGTIYEGMGEHHRLLTIAQTPEDAAVIFAKHYERCAAWSYGPRRRYAREAYDYFRRTE